MLQRILYLFAFEAELFGVVHVLPLAAAAQTEVRADRFDPVGRGLYQFAESRDEEFFLYLEDFSHHGIADRRGALNKNAHAILKPPEALIFIAQIENLDLHYLFLFIHRARRVGETFVGCKIILSSC